MTCLYIMKKQMKELELFAILKKKDPKTSKV